MPVLCHCGETTSIVSAELVYGPDYADMVVCICDNYPACDSYVGCHKETGVPLGIPGTKYDRRYRRLLHSYFDCLWRRGPEGRPMSRKKAYELLEEISGCKHIAEMRGSQCIDTLALLKTWANSNLGWS